MNAKLEEILKAYDSFREAFDDDEAAHWEAVYDSLLEEIIARNPRVSKDALRRFTETEHRKWLLAQKKPATLLPKA
jgi:hypothetical protein